MTGRGLEPIAPAEAVELYISHRRDDARYASLRKMESGLSIFQNWAGEVGLTNMNDLSGRHLIEFKRWRKEETGIKKAISLNGALAYLQRFLRFCENIDAVETDLAEKVPLPNVPPEEEVSEVVPTDEEVESMRAYHEKFEYASRRQTQLELIAEIAIRLGAVRAIDLDDFDLQEQTIDFRHRPEGPDVYGTPLKNGKNGERIVNLPGGLAKTVQDYIEHHRADVIDEFGRAPLFTTKHGRVTRSTIRRDFYKLTRPCSYSNECPHDREISSCEGTKDSKTDRCPSRFSTHPLRRWSIMHQLDAGVPMELVSDRVDVSVPILEKHYDQRSKERKADRRLKVLSDTFSGYSN